MSSSNSRSAGQTRSYKRANSVVFLKTKEAFGGLSNMAGGYPLRVNGVRMLTSEALYQACRFPHLPDVQRLIIEERSPMTAKMKTKPHRTNSRGDWFQVRVKIMRWCLRVKLAQNWRKFSELLLETGDRPIVEQSRKDDFWGAKPVDEDTLVGMNVLGRLLMELREAVKTETRETLCFVEPLAIPDFLLGGEPIGVVATRVAEIAREQTLADVQVPLGHIDDPAVAQHSLFDEPVAAEVPLQTNPGVKDSGVRIADMKPYSEYKESGSSWLGCVPQHWDVLPLAGLARLKSVKNQSERQLLSVYLQRGVVRFSDVGEKRTNATSEDLSNYQAVDPGDFVLNNQQAWRGSVGVSSHSGIVSPAYLVLALSGRYSSRYANLLLRDQSMVSQYLVCSKGVGTIQRNLYWPHLKRVGVVVPPPDEQAAIVRFLDWANGRLERTIRAKRKTIALLDEQKQAVIHRAVTRGLDPSVSLKPSGIAWLGDIPQHWEVRKVRTVAELIVSNVDKHSKANETGVRLCNYVDVYKNDTINERLAFMQATATIDEIERFRIRVGDVIITKDSEKWDDIGVPSLVTYEADDLVCGYHLAILRHRPKLITGTFLHRVLEDRFVATQMHVRAKGVTRYGLGHSAIKDVLLPLPPVLEQGLICSQLEVDLEAFVVATTRLEREIELLREYRTRMVADVVTGKLDVREAAVRLPDEGQLDTVEDGAELDDETEPADEETAV